MKLFIEKVIYLKNCLWIFSLIFFPRYKNFENKLMYVVCLFIFGGLFLIVFFILLCCLVWEILNDYVFNEQACMFAFFLLLGYFFGPFFF